MAGTTIVRDAESAARALAVLRRLPPSTIHACDTEVAYIDVKKQGPVGHGRVICASIYSGPDVDFGSGPRLWIDNLDEADGVLDHFREWFQDNGAQKVWHNYSFDRHVLHNTDGIDCRGFAGDTMHMARVWDSARGKLHGGGGYSLAALTSDLLDTPKVSMKEIFGVRKIKKDGTPSKQPAVLPPMEDLQRSEATRREWIHYAALDAEVTWHLHSVLADNLTRMPWAADRHMLDFFREYIVPFGEMLTDIERVGILIDCDYLKGQEAVAVRERREAQELFMSWAAQQCTDARLMNPGSGAQIQTLLFAPCQNSKRSTEWMDATRDFSVANLSDTYIEPGKDRVLKKRKMTLSGLGWTPSKYTASGWPATTSDVIKTLAGKDGGGGGEGSAMAFYDTERAAGRAEGRAACLAMDALSKVNSIDTMLSTFLRPLQELPDAGRRVHCSLNLNTETGRLSSRMPNLQNQPALEKDRYRIRSAFTCPPDHALVVADYGQLELRVLAHMAECESMIAAFKLGGDFHSRTAMGMYPHIQAALDREECVLEWDARQGKAPVPLVKDLFTSERRKAKVLNFSIAYGKTAHGLSKDFGTTVGEAKETLERWYQDRPEVRTWQEKTIENARRTGFTRTLMGRYRQLPDITDRSRQRRSHAERAAINTPIQGGAADIVMKAMIKLHHNPKLRELGFRMVLQIHDEVIMEGPLESVEEAQALLIEDMCHPFLKPLLVDLVVDAKSAKTWYEAK